MTRLSRTLAAGAVCAALALVTPTAHADGLPFKDEYAKGYVGFCDEQGNPVTEGKIGDAPFVWTAVSSTPAPAGYGAGKGKAVLDAFQPRQDVDPLSWSGKQLTAATIFTNSRHPMAKATAVDPAMVDFTAVFPPSWQGLVELRMYFGALGKPSHSYPYPATVIKVTGDSWRVVDGGTVPCDSGRAMSVETLTLPKHQISPSVARATPGAYRSAGNSGAHRTGPGSASGAVQPVGAGNSPPAARGAVHSTAAADSRSATSSSTPWWIVGVVLVAAVAVAGGALLRRRRSA